MPIPEDVMAEADVYLDDPSGSERAYRVIAEWARKEALKEAARSIDDTETRRHILAQAGFSDGEEFD